MEKEEGMRGAGCGERRGKERLCQMGGEKREVKRDGERGEGRTFKMEN